MFLIITAVLAQLGCTTVRPAAEAARTPVSPSPLATMSDEDKRRQQEYFRDHSFDFSSIFSAYHPGPYWILANQERFQFSPEQLARQDSLKLGMAMATITANRALQAAYARYATDAAATDPSVTAIQNDIEEIGRAQTQLAQAMVPFHLQAYAALTPAQQAVYRALVAERSQKK
jgi:Spy/CpxP family protein refolding chaperone